MGDAEQAAEAYLVQLEKDATGGTERWMFVKQAAVVQGRMSLLTAKGTYERMEALITELKSFKEKSDETARCLVRATWLLAVVGIVVPIVIELIHWGATK